MKYRILFFALLFTSSAFSCEWQVKVIDNTSNEIKYYKVQSGKRTEFIITSPEEKPFAACGAFLQKEALKEEREGKLTKIETGVLMCAYVDAPEYPISANASRFIYKEMPEHRNPVIMNLFSVPDTGKLLKPLYLLRMSCRN